MSRLWPLLQTSANMFGVHIFACVDTVFSLLVLMNISIIGVHACLLLVCMSRSYVACKPSISCICVMSRMCAFLFFHFLYFLCSPSPKFSLISFMGYIVIKYVVAGCYFFFSLLIIIIIGGGVVWCNRLCEQNYESTTSTLWLWSKNTSKHTFLS